MAAERKRLLVTGGTGLLGRHLKGFLPDALFPTSSEFDVRDFAMMKGFLEKNPVATIVHCAALTSPPRADKEPMLALDVNIVGTANLVRLCQAMSLRLVYISTDYVFDGSGGCTAKRIR